MPFEPKQIDLSHFTLRVHQEAFLAHVLPRIHSDDTGKKYLYSSPTGSGKSLMFLSVVARDPFAWGITPRIEIIADMLVKCGEDVSGLNTEAIVDLALSYRITTPIRMRNMLAKGTFPVEPRQVWRLVVDECFVKGTKVDGRNIEDIKPGDTVHAFNPDTGEVSKRTVVRNFKNPAPTRLMKLTAGTISLVGTEGHPFLTSRGWKLAGQLEVGDILYRMSESVHCSERTPATEAPERASGVLLPAMLPTDEQPDSDANLCRMQDGIRSYQSGSTASAQQRTTNVLHSEVRADGGSTQFIDYYGEHEPQVCIGTHESKQPDEQSRNTGENVTDTTGDRTQAKCSGRERSGVDCTRTNAIQCDGATTVYSSDSKNLTVSPSLQTRFSRPDDRVSGGDRRNQSFCIEGTGSRRTERNSLEAIRVDRIEILESGSDGEFERVCPDGYVYNLEVEGEHTYFANNVAVHNCHHFPASTYQEILAYIPWVTVVGLTATPFRGTPKGTKEFLDMWDEYTPVMNIPEAAAMGVISVPDFQIWPLVDDDLITVVNGEFSASASADATASRYTELVQRIDSSRMLRTLNVVYAENPETGEVAELVDRQWNVPTLFAVSTTEQCNQLAEYLAAANMPATAITQATTRADRAEAFKQCLTGETAIVQIDVVSEGVDLAIRRIIDLRPTFSPVRWLQLVGRATRPGGQSTYICCCRNIERHAYLFEGMIPPATIAAAQQSFGSPSARSGVRVVGIEGLGRFQAASVHFADNTVGAIYTLYSVEGAHKREFGVVLHPASAEPIYAEKISTMKEDGTRDYGKWQRIEAIPDVQGFASTPPKTVTDKQKESYTRNGRRWGLDTSVEVNRKNIQAFFILRDLFPSGFKL